DYKVKTIPGIPAINVDMHAGHIPTIGDTEYFFWLFNSKNKSNKLVIWLNGGPGCSSMDGVFLENGPFRFNGTTLVENKHSWYANANMLYLDQPAGTGYSISPEKNFAKNQDDVNRHFLAFLDHFYKIFDNFKDHELFIAGESYAGTWIPHITLAILNRNKKSPELYLPIKSILIGNGWIDPIYQVGTLLSKSFLEEAQLAMETCRNELHKLPSITNQHCEGVMDSILDYSKQDGKYCLNKYDIRLHDKGPNEGCGMSWPTGVYEMKDYLARHDVRNALHAQKYTSKSWTECSWSVYQHIVSDPTPPSITVFPALLEQLPINLFVGDQDLICNILGFKNMITLLTWNGAQGIDVLCVY
ncbi:peptidase S10, serine carboxypeptidase, partial [Globomyces pollinis-pini]